MESQAALQDFLKAIKEGPDWTQIPGCSRVSSKAMNCLYIDPRWKSRGPRENEKKKLERHEDWRGYLGSTLKSPPYIAYLACYVLAWTERPVDFNHNDYYGPLNDLLGLNGSEKLDTFDFGPYYQIPTGKGSIINLWKDLEKWGFENDVGVCYLPSALVDIDQAHARYVDVPKYFGLLKAVDMRSLPQIFSLLEEAGVLIAGQVPAPIKMVEIICNSKEACEILSATSISNLQDAQGACDEAMLEAYGKLLCAKYREFDVFLDDDFSAEDHGNTRCRARLFRFLDCSGQLQVTCRLCRENAWEILPMEAGKDYAFNLIGPENAKFVTKWIPNTPWFGLMNIIREQPLEGARITSDDLSFSAQLASRDILVLRSWGLPFHLRSGYLEVDELEQGRDYVVLSLTNNAPNFDGLRFNPLQIKAPKGFSCWKMRVPKDPQHWPSVLPPVLEEKHSKPTIRIMGFRLSARASSFPLQFPPSVQSSHGFLEVFVKDSPANMQASFRSFDGDQTLSAAQEGKVILALRDNIDHQIEVKDSHIEVELVDITKQAPCSVEPSLLATDHVPFKPYPHAKIKFEGGRLAPLVSLNPHAYLASSPPKVYIEAHGMCSNNIRLFINKQLIAKVPFTAKQIMTKNESGLFRFECQFNEILLDRAELHLKPEPKLNILGLSKNEDSPTPVSETVCATIEVDGDQAEDVHLDYKILDAGSVVSGGSIKTRFRGPITKISDAGLKPEATYQLRFEVCGEILDTRWFKVRPRRGTFSLPKRGPTQGLNSMSDAFSNFKFPQADKGGH